MVLLQEDDVTALPGEVSRRTVHIVNTGPVVDRFDLDIVGDVREWITVEPDQVRVFPHEMVEAEVVFSPPRAFDISAGSQTYALRVMSHADVEGSVVEEGTVMVAPFVDFDIGCTPRTRRSRLTGRFNVVVDNRGNSLMPVQLFAEDPDSTLRCRFRHDEVEVPSGRGVLVPLKVRPKRLRWGGTETNVSFQCLAVADGEERRTVDATLTQVPLLGEGVGKFVLATVAAFAALLALWFFALQPSVTSEARRQGQEQAGLAQPALPSTAPPSPSDSTPGTQGGVSGSDGGSGQSPGTDRPSAPDPTGTGPSATPGATGLNGRPLDFRVETNVPVSAEFTSQTGYTVPAKTTLYLSDIFLENTANDSGVIRIERDGSVLMQFGLDTFRNADRHLNQPLVFGPGHKVNLAVRCDKPGADSEASPSAGCTPAAYFSGQLSSP